MAIGNFFVLFLLALRLFSVLEASNVTSSTQPNDLFNGTTPNPEPMNSTTVSENPAPDSTEPTEVSGQPDPDSTTEGSQKPNPDPTSTSPSVATEDFDFVNSTTTTPEGEEFYEMPNAVKFYMIAGGNVAIIVVASIVTTTLFCKGRIITPGSSEYRRWPKPDPVLHLEARPRKKIRQSHLPERTGVSMLNEAKKH
ncbi:hypothetical protein QR680_016823 [Steinernema hermaphroditum]|uniref:Uncharacterized protein n=1 Tax=Steinernema hermaphroditum TaxID=289476 RepID=A0AA39HCE6_9BILA|nr:hypothetical protein QR680_016823 [Steinernema hermaphroditum]